jgi:hypothetical protein
MCSRALQPFPLLTMLIMSSSSPGVRCTAHNGAVWMHLDDVPMKIPPSLLDKSKTFTEALSSVADPSIATEFTVAAPKEWLRAWVALYGSEEEPISKLDVEDLLNCLLVRSFPGTVRRVGDVMLVCPLLTASMTSLDSHHVPSSTLLLSWTFRPAFCCFRCSGNGFSAFCSCNSQAHRSCGRIQTRLGNYVLIAGSRPPCKRGPRTRRLSCPCSPIV